MQTQTNFPIADSRQFSRVRKYISHIVSAGAASLVCLVALLPVPSAFAGVNRWTAIGPDGANVVALLIDPRTPSMVFAGTRGAGVLKSADGGVSWASANAGLPTFNVSALAIDPSVPATLYAGTDTGVFKSTDGGRNWAAAGTGLDSARGVFVGALAIDPGSPATLYAGTSGGMFKTTNAGASWVPINSGLTINGFTPVPVFITIDPTSPATLYIGVDWASVFKSTDAGASWTLIHRPYDEADEWPGVNALAIDLQTPSRLYLATDEGIVISQDGGASWSADYAPGCSIYSRGYCGSPVLAGLRISALAIDPAMPATVYAGIYDGRVYRTTDGGDHWTIVGSLGGPGSNINAIAAAASGPSTFYAGSSTGLFRSADRGHAWSRVTLGVATIPVGRLAVDSIAPSTIYATLHGRVAKTTDGGVHWRDSSQGLTDSAWISSLATDPLSPSTLFASSSTVFKSTDAGASWAPAPFASDPFYRANTMVIAPSPPSTLYIGVAFMGVLKTTDAAGSWTPVNNGLTAVGIYVSALAVDPTNADIVYVATPPTGRPDTDAKIFKSTNGAAQWRQLPIALPSGTSITALTIDPSTPSTIYATYDAYGKLGVGVYKSIDGGETWIAPTNLLPTTRVSVLAIDPALPSTIYAGTLAGVFRSTDGAVSWTPLNTGLSSFEVRDLALDRTGTLLRAATAGGLFEYRVGPMTPGIVAVVEYHHAAFDHYFMTASTDEIASLDNGTIAGWTRTGLLFNAYLTPHENSVPVCRFVSTAFAPKSSHFYTPYAGECALLQANRDWLLESADAFELDLPAVDGSCAAGATPVYRLYNNDQGGAPNHRYTTDPTVRAQMLAQGWVREGVGADTVNMCSPQ